MRAQVLWPLVLAALIYAVAEHAEQAGEYGNAEADSYDEKGVEHGSSLGFGI